METSIHFPHPYLAEGTVRITSADYEAEYRQKLREMRQVVSLPGFRPGRVPMDILMGRHGEEILSEILTHQFFEALRGALGEKDIFQLPYIQRTPDKLHIKPPFADYEYRFRVLVVPTEPLITAYPRVTEYEYAPEPQDEEFIQRYLRMTFGTLEELAEIPEAPPADKDVILRLRWAPYEGAMPLRLRWNSLIMPFPWSYLAGKKVGESFSVPPQTLSAYVDYIRTFYPDFSLLTTDSVTLTITGAAYAIPLSEEELHTRLAIAENSADHWRNFIQTYTAENLSILNQRLRKKLLIQAAGIRIPDEYLQYLYLHYLSHRTQESKSPLDYYAFQDEIGFLLVLRNIIASQPELKVEEEDVSNEFWERLKQLPTLSDELRAQIQAAEESESLKEELIEKLLTHELEETIRDRLQDKRVEDFLSTQMGEPIKQPLSLKSILLYTL